MWLQTLHRQDRKAPAGAGWSGRRFHERGTLDVLWQVKQMSPVPVGAYNVSGEYAMIKAAAQNGWIDERRVTMEVLTGIRRAGADMIITYFAPEVASWLKEK